MKTKLLCSLAAVLLLAACGGGEEQPQSSVATTSAASTGIGDAGTVAASDLDAAQNVRPGTQEDLEVNVGDRVFFVTDSSALDQASQDTLSRQAVWMQEFDDVTLTVEGHADERGSAEYNLALGERRATAVKTYLTTLGVQPDRIGTVSYGKERPADPGHNESAWALNRRAVSVVNLGY